jgi:hypothetical protein
MADSKYKATLNYPSGPKARAEILKDNMAMKKPVFEDLKEAEDYASELQRETRGKKAGGTIRSASSRADGIAAKGKTKGRMV